MLVKHKLEHFKYTRFPKNDGKLFYHRVFKFVGQTLASVDFSINFKFLTEKR